MTRETEARRVGLPIRPFLYTIPQVADLLAMKEASLKRGYIYFHGVHAGVPPLDKLQARNIAPQGEDKEWRVAEKELIRWLRRMGFRVIDSTSLKS